VTSFPPTSDPSTISGRLGHPWFLKDRARTFWNDLSIKQNTWKPPDQSSLHNVGRTRISSKADAKLVFSSEDKFRCDPPIQAKGRRPSLADPSGAQRQRRDSVRTKYGGAERDRTADPLLAKQVLSQLSYSPIQLDRHQDDLSPKRLGNITHQPIQVCHPYRTIVRRMAPSRRAGPKVRTARECKAIICVANGGPG
jgi:hypothetical protein